MRDVRISEQTSFNQWMTIRLALHYLLKWHLTVSKSIQISQLSEREKPLNSHGRKTAGKF